MPFIQFVSLPKSISMDPSQAAAEGRDNKWWRISVLSADTDEYFVQFWDSSAPRVVGTCVGFWADVHFSVSGSSVPPPQHGQRFCESGNGELHGVFIHWIFLQELKLQYVRISV